MATKSVAKVSLSIVLVALALGLSAYNGFFSWVGIGLEPGRGGGISDHQYWAELLPAFLWIAAGTSLKFPRVGFCAYLFVLAASGVLWMDPIDHPDRGWYAFSLYIYHVRFALYGGGLLLLNLFLLSVWKDENVPQ